MLTTNPASTITTPSQPATKQQFLDTLAKSRADAQSGRVKELGVALEEIRAKYHL